MREWDKESTLYRNFLTITMETYQKKRILKSYAKHLYVFFSTYGRHLFYLECLIVKFP